MSSKKLTDEQELAILKSHGWQTLWHPNHWIKKSWLLTVTNIDWAGVTREEALQCIFKEIDGNTRSPKPLSRLE